MSADKRAIFKAFRSGRRILRDDSGQALIELALTMPLLLLILFGAVEMAHVTYASIEVSNAAMAGVQYGTQNTATAADTTGIQNAAIADAPNVTLQTPSVTLTNVCSDGSTPSGSPLSCKTGQLQELLTVKTQASFTPFVHLAGIGSSFTLYGQAVQKVFQ